jgi:hypothetical protein
MVVDVCPPGDPHCRRVFFCRDGLARKPRRPLQSPLRPIDRLWLNLLAGLILGPGLLAEFCVLFWYHPAKSRTAHNVGFDTLLDPLRRRGDRYYFYRDCDLVREPVNETPELDRVGADFLWSIAWTGRFGVPFTQTSYRPPDNPSF